MNRATVAAATSSFLIHALIFFLMGSLALKNVPKSVQPIQFQIVATASGPAPAKGEGATTQGAPKRNSPMRLQIKPREAPPSPTEAPQVPLDSAPTAEVEPIHPPEDGAGADGLYKK